LIYGARLFGAQDYPSGRKIFDDRIEFFNPGTLPAGLTVKKLISGDYVSMIRNRLIADIFMEGGLIEKYGTGIRRILKAFRDYGLPDPKFEEVTRGFRVTVYCHRTKIEKGKVAGEVRRLLSLCREPISRRELMVKLGLRHEDHFRKAYLIPALEAELIERTVPDKPRSRLQRYRLTTKEKAFLEKNLPEG
jgi:ATP-dependent DNA helicase RecG